MPLAEVKALPVKNFNNLPQLLRDMAKKIESRERPVEVMLLITMDEGGSLNLYNWGESVNAYEFIGMIEAAKQELLE